MFTIPYRWRLDTVHKNIGWMWYSITRGIRNIFRWLPVVWNDEDFDWDWLAKMMEFKLRNMSSALEHGNGMSDKKSAREMRICAELLKRLQDDSFDDLERFGKLKYNMHEQRMVEWQRTFGNIMGKSMRSWWT